MEPYPGINEGLDFEFFAFSLYGKSYKIIFGADIPVFVKYVCAT